MKLDYNKEVMLKVVSDKPDLGKTAVMKIMFILQQILDMNFGYDFEIYTYGPYTSEVTDDMEALINEDYMDAKVFPYKNSIAYHLTITEKGENSINNLSDEDEVKITKVLEMFGDKTAKELELDSTIIYVKALYNRNAWENIKKDIIDDVHEIKPHFTVEAIESAYNRLDTHGMLPGK